MAKTLSNGEMSRKTKDALLGDPGHVDISTGNDGDPLTHFWGLKATSKGKDAEIDDLKAKLAEYESKFGSKAHASDAKMDAKDAEIEALQAKVTEYETALKSNLKMLDELEDIYAEDEKRMKHLKKKLKKETKAKEQLEAELTVAVEEMAQLTNRVAELEEKGRAQAHFVLEMEAFSMSLQEKLALVNCAEPPTLHEWRPSSLSAAIVEEEAPRKSILKQQPKHAEIEPQAQEQAPPLGGSVHTALTADTDDQSQVTSRSKGSHYDQAATQAALARVQKNIAIKKEKSTIKKPLRKHSSLKAALNKDNQSEHKPVQESHKAPPEESHKKGPSTGLIVAGTAAVAAGATAAGMAAKSAAKSKDQKNDPAQPEDNEEDSIQVFPSGDSIDSTATPKSGPSNGAIVAGTAAVAAGAAAAAVAATSARKKKEKKGSIKENFSKYCGEENDEDKPTETASSKPAPQRRVSESLYTGAGGRAAAFAAGAGLAGFLQHSQRSGFAALSAEPAPTRQMVTVQVEKQEGTKLGLTLDETMDDNVIITNIRPGGLVADTKLRKGMILSTVNGKGVDGKTSAEVAGMLMHAEGMMTISAYTQEDDAPEERETIEDISSDLVVASSTATQKAVPAFHRSGAAPARVHRTNSNSAALSPIRHPNKAALRGLFKQEVKKITMVNMFARKKFINWSATFRRQDPRYQILDFFNLVAQNGTEALAENCQAVQTGHCNKKCLPISMVQINRSKYSDLQGGTKNVWTKAGVFTVWRPTSLDSIRKMMLGEGVGKGLDIKGKSAKKGQLSGFVPYLQLHEERHKSMIRTIPKDARIRLFFTKEKARDIVHKRLQEVCQEMVHGYAKSEQTIKLVQMAEKAGNLSAEEQQANSDLLEDAVGYWMWEMEDTTITVLDEYEPTRWGLELPQRLFHEAYVMRGDCRREPGSIHDTGRLSEPAFQDMNNETLRTHKANAPRPVVLQKTEDPEKVMDPRYLLIAYEEVGQVVPVVSDFDCFLVGTRRVNFITPLPAYQVELMKWCITVVERILELEPSTETWTMRWLEELKQEYEKGFHVDLPKYGFADPQSYSIMAHAIDRLAVHGSVRHGAECFNFYFPQDLDDEFLVVTNNQPNGPWVKYSKEGLLKFLSSQVDKGFMFPINPKWALCDPGWKELYDKQISSDNLTTRRAMDSWYPPESGIREMIERIHANHPKAFQVLHGTYRMEKPKYSPLRQAHEDGEEICGDTARDMALLEVRHHRVLKKAVKAVNAVLFANRLSRQSMASHTSEGSPSTETRNDEDPKEEMKVQDPTDVAAAEEQSEQEEVQEGTKRQSSLKVALNKSKEGEEIDNQNTHQETTDALSTKEGVEVHDQADRGTGPESEQKMQENAPTKKPSSLKAALNRSNGHGKVNGHNQPPQESQQEPQDSSREVLTVHVEKRGSAKLGLTLCEVDGKVVITHIKEGGLVSRTELAPGMEVSSINGTKMAKKSSAEAAGLLFAALGTVTIVAIKGGVEDKSKSNDLGKASVGANSAPAVEAFPATENHSISAAMKSDECEDVELEEDVQQEEAEGVKQEETEAPVTGFMSSLRATIRRTYSKG